MESQALHAAVRRLREAIAPPAAPDADLVRAFAAHREAGAFEQIVRRHGPMVLGVCRRLLRHSADADDAFQATFLVFLRKAGSLRDPDRLAGWLHQVAHRTARKLRALRLKRAGREGELFDVPAGESPAEIVWRELRPLFDAELARLPDRLRLPAVLCLLEGQSKSEAARALGWPEGTLSGRLQRARERLRVRLAARGLTLSAGAFAAAWFEGSGAAAVPDRLIEITLQGASNPAAAAGARALADGVTQAMFLTKVKAVAAAVLVAGVVGSGTGVALVPGSGPTMVVAGEPQKEPPAKEVPARPRETGDGKARPTGSDVDLRRKELSLLKERLAWEEQMFKKGFVSESQVKTTRLEVERAEAALAKGEGSPPGKKAKASPPHRAAMEAVLKKLEEIATAAEEGFKKGVVPQQELLNAQLKVLEYKVKLLEFDDSPPPGRPAVDKNLADRIADKQAELARGEALLKRKAISLEEVARMRMDLAKLRAEAATVGGDYAEATRQREAIVSELNSEANTIRGRVEKKVSPRAELQGIEVAVAEARVEALKAATREQLAKIVAVREEEFRQVQTLFDSKAASVEEVRRAERALAEARARLADEK